MKFWRNHSKAATLAMQSTRAAVNSVCYPMAVLLRGTGVLPAHEYIRIPSTSKAALRNDERKRALAGTLFTPEEHKARCNPFRNRKGDREWRNTYRRLFGTADYNRGLARQDRLDWDGEFDDKEALVH